MKAKELTPVESSIQKMQKELKQRRSVLAWVKTNKFRFDSIPDLRAQFWDGHIDFNSLSHADVLRVMKAFPCGKWTKTPNSQPATVDYVGEFEGMAIRCWAGEPPPFCKIIEEEVFVPAHTKVILKLECPKNTLQV